ncbi:MAG: hypothetical protein RMA76_33390 [Deltaproteobacteria bacterium]|jgi:hypothetical protein
MFCDIDKVDIVVAEDDGSNVGVQTDHRGPDEIDFDRSVALALARIWGPLSHGVVEAVRMDFVQEPPETFRRVVEAAGAEVHAAMEPLERLQTVDQAVAEEALHGALANVAAEVFAEHGLEATVDGLHALEAALAPRFEGFDDLYPEERYTLILQLGAAAGAALMHRESGGRWVRDETFLAGFPFTVDVEGASANLFGRAERFFHESPNEGPSRIVANFKEEADGPIVPVLRLPLRTDVEHDEARRPLLDVPDVEAMPWIYLARDMPSSIAYILDLDREGFDTLLEHAVAGLAQIHVETERLEVDGFTVLALTGHFFATSKLLDPSFLRAMTETLDGEMLFVAIPGSQLALIAACDPQHIGTMVALAENAYAEQEPSYQLTPLVFVANATDGIVGFARLKTDEEATPEAAPKKPWWKRLFTKD